jgi:DNA-binding MarR family transcriptional regulator
MNPREDLETELGYRAMRSIRQIIHHVSSHSRLMSRDSGLTVPQLLCIRAIHVSASPMNVAAVSEAVHISRPTVSGVVDRLVRAGLVERTRSPQDRRQVQLSLTDAGRMKMAEMPKPLQSGFLDRLGALDEQEQERLLSALEQLAAMMVAPDVDGSE